MVVAPSEMRSRRSSLSSLWGHASHGNCNDAIRSCPSCRVRRSRSASAADLAPSQIACDASKIGARDLADCLRTNSDRAERDLAAETDAAVKSIDGRQGVLNAQKARWKRSLNDAEAQWLELA